MEGSLGGMIITGNQPFNSGCSFKMLGSPQGWKGRGSYPASLWGAEKREFQGNIFFFGLEKSLLLMK